MPSETKTRIIVWRWSAPWTAGSKSCAADEQRGGEPGAAADMSMMTAQSRAPTIPKSWRSGRSRAIGTRQVENGPVKRWAARWRGRRWSKSSRTRTPSRRASGVDSIGSGIFQSSGGGRTGRARRGAERRQQFARRRRVSSMSPTTGSASAYPALLTSQRGNSGSSAAKTRQHRGDSAHIEHDCQP